MGTEAASVTAETTAGVAAETASDVPAESSAGVSATHVLRQNCRGHQTRHQSRNQ